MDSERTRPSIGTAVTGRAPLVDVVEQAQLVEGLGYDSIWIPEISGRDAFVTATILASRTARIRLCTGVIPLPSRSLSTLAMAAAAVSEWVPGRFILGIGAGHSETAHSQFGWPGAASVHDVESAVSALRSALRTGVLRQELDGSVAELEMQGQHVTTAPPVVIGALRPGMARAAGRSADGMLLNWVTVGRAERLVTAARAESPRDRPFRVSCYVPVCVVSDEAQNQAARVAVARQLSSYVQLRAYGDVLIEDGFAEDVSAVRQARADHKDATLAVTDALIDAIALIGTASAVLAGLDDFRAVGVDEPVLAPVAVGEDSASSMALTWASLAP